ncbi:MAG: hypothetical protein M1503_12485 [Thaumarchaeota archaeon]|nr:hypothetical protein [Nitrososphaerota archaeon]MCL5319057.1 hypothetical protein [Nitrososphaerota archaeon]
MEESVVVLIDVTVDTAANTSVDVSVMVEVKVVETTCVVVTVVEFSGETLRMKSSGA